ncbi:granulocyte colony-stimulating factor receptor isoform X2 [Rhinatrema bivittatum]|uniref:granulocyte colony-stimulating factor receptor isoform X2 n=1 Tax=Rhinatrema bivittatum TaxID=194408 RepID=UPI00112D415C|nr:granulocyte colony-stimulating factor receptor isoform X2 [Rhinatrema bivittatum]
MHYGRCCLDDPPNFAKAIWEPGTMVLPHNRETLPLGALLLLLFAKGVQPYAHVAVQSPIVPLGSPVTATCTINRTGCIGLEEEDIQILWKLDDEYLPDPQQNNSTGAISSRVTVRSFNRTMAILSCYAAGIGIPQLMGRVEIHAGYPPSKPSNLSCIMNLTEESLTCTWSPGQETYLETNVTLERQRSRDGALPEKKPDCAPLKGQNHCTVPRELLNLYQKEVIWVTAQNALGKSESEKLCLVPMDAVKLDPPTIETIKSSSLDGGCLSVLCRKPREGTWLSQLYELRYKAEEDAAWSVISSSQSPDVMNRSMQIKGCGFLAARVYYFQVRCMKEFSQGHWSMWSPVITFLTPKTAPVGKLDVWWKMDQQGSGKKTKVQLMWKPMSRKDSNGDILGYLVFLITGQGQDGVMMLCNTTKVLCDFPMPPRAAKVYIKAYNAAGESPATDVVLFSKQGLPPTSIRAFPKDDHSLYVEWEASKISVVRYVIEWYRVSEQASCNISWKTEVGAGTSSLLQENIEPFQLFHISLYPVYEDAVGLPLHTEAYTKQKAPSSSPRLHLKSIGRSQAEIEWNPIPIEKRHGFITNYTIFWKDSKGWVSYAILDASSRNFLIKNLEASNIYKVHLMSSTAGGRTNGTILTIHTTVLNTEIYIVIVVLFLVFTLTICLVLTIYFKKHQKMKNHFWPNVPDPANSSLGEWMPTKLQEGNKGFPNTKDSNHIITSNITILDREIFKKPSPTRKGDISAQSPQISPGSSFQPNASDRLQGFICPSVAKMGENAQRPSYMNMNNTVQYAKVIVDPFRGQRVPTPLYLRSDSTQPLLCDMSPSPKPYENLWFHGGSQYFQEDAVFQECELSLMDFPLLQGLKIQGIDDLNDSHNFTTLKHNRN